MRPMGRRPPASRMRRYYGNMPSDVPKTSNLGFAPPGVLSDPGPKFYSPIKILEVNSSSSCDGAWTSDRSYCEREPPLSLYDIFEPKTDLEPENLVISAPVVRHHGGLWREVTAGNKLYTRVTTICNKIHRRAHIVVALVDRWSNPRSTNPALATVGRRDPDPLTPPPPPPPRFANAQITRRATFPRPPTWALLPPGSPATRDPSPAPR